MCKRLVLSSAALFLIFVGVLPKAIHCMPAASSDPVYNGGSVQDVPTQPPNGQCVPFSNHYCNQFDNRNMAYFPNPRGHSTPEAAAAEFDDFIPLLKSGCHPKLGTLLCFIYFPQCFTNYPDVKIYPCNETCQEVTESDSKCTKLLNDYDFSWNKALQCDKPHFKSGGLCANGDAPAFLDNNSTSTDNNTSPDVQATEEAPTDSMDVETTEEPTDSMDVETTEEPTDSEEQCDSDDQCPSACDYRENANSGTFRRNAYCYAARVTVKSHELRDCHHTYTVEVKNQYDLQSPFNSTHSTKAPSMGDSAVIFTSRSHCTRCPKLEVSKTYLISGPYSRAADGSMQWRLGDSKDKALASEWESKYDRKLTTFLDNGNRERKSELRFKQECENDARLVSAEQWIRH